MKLKLHSGSLKLASLYLAIIIAISFIFSTVIYQLSVHELSRGLRGQGAIMTQPIGPGFSSEIRQLILDERNKVYEEARARVIGRLLLLNLIIVVSGGLLSYFLALWTLKPIEEAHEAQKRFTADASHELRTPITAMMAENEVALMDSGLSLEDARAQIRSNIDELNNLTNLSESLMRLAGLESTSIEPEEIFLRQLLEESVQEVSGLAKKRSILVKLKLDNKDLRIFGDRVSLRELFVILLDNAIKYSPEKSGISVSTKTTESNVLISIEDHGVGISESDLAHIFERFYRADQSRAKHNVRGFGLGLSIAYEIAQKHDGDIKVTSTVGKGSVFVVSLPRSTTNGS